MARKRIPRWLQRVQYGLFRMLTGFVQLLPLHWDYALVNLVTVAVYYIDGYHRRRAVTHVLHSGIRTTRPEAVALVKASFKHLGKVFVEIVKFPQIVTKENFREYFSLESPNECWKAFLSSPEAPNAILLTGHLGNWELAGQAYTLLSGHQMVSIMRPLENEFIGAYFYRHREAFGHTTISKDKGILPLFRALLEGKSIAIVADQHASTREGMKITFCGHPASAHKSPSLLALRGKKTIICGALIRVDDDFHFKMAGAGPVEYTPTGDREADVANITQLYSNCLEELLRKYPEQWLWSHRRWLDCNRPHR